MRSVGRQHPVALLTAVLLLLLAAAACLARGLAGDGSARADPSPVVVAVAGDHGRAETPRRLVARAIGVHAPVVAVAPAGTALDAPSRSRVGWWVATTNGVVAGPQVLVGHTAAAGGGVFDRLGRLRPGQAVALVTGAGVERYRVTRVRVTSVEAFARQAGSLSDPAATGDLVLVTCSGWDGSRFRSTTLVTAVPEERGEGG